MASKSSQITKTSLINKKSVTGLLTQITCSGSENLVYKALVDIRTNILKQSDGLVRLRQRGGSQVLLDVLQKQPQRVHDVCLSILGNCCMDENFRAEILQRDGVAVVGVLLQETKLESIQNRACRTLANLSLDPAGCLQIHKVEGLLESLINILKNAGNPETQQTFIRIIRLLSDTECHRVAVIEQRGLKVVADLLASENDSVSRASLKTITHFISEHPTAPCALQLDLAGVPKYLLNGVVDKNSGLVRHYESMLLIMMKHECFRPGLGNNGAIDYFVMKIGDSEASKDVKYANINALCLTCKESLNRVRIRELGGLQLLLQLLADDHMQLIHNRLVSSLLCFLYDEPSIQVLLSNNVLGIFMSHVSKCTEQKTGSLSIPASFKSALEKVITAASKEPTRDDSDDADNMNIVDLSIVKLSGEATTDCLSMEMLDHSVINDQQAKSSPSTGESPDKISGKHVSPTTLPKYSMDSPTYKEISESTLEMTYDIEGPRNISERHDYGTSSGRWSPVSSLGSPLRCPSPGAYSYSPLSNASTYVSPTWSLQSSSLGDQSPEWDRELSPLSCDISSPTSSPSKLSPPLHVSSTWPGEFSPTAAVTYTSPEKHTTSTHRSLSSPAQCGADGVSDSDATPQYSSSEADDNEGHSDGESCTGNSQSLAKDHKSTTVGNILIFVSRVSFMDSARKYLSKPSILHGLMELVTSTNPKDDNWKRAYRILVRIFRTPCLESVISYAVPMILTLMWNQSNIAEAPALVTRGGDSCPEVLDQSAAISSLLQVLSEEIQTQYGGGVIEHGLLTGTITQRMNTYISLPVIYSEPVQLRSVVSCFPQGTELMSHILAQAESAEDILLSTAVVLLSRIFTTFRACQPKKCTCHKHWKDTVKPRSTEYIANVKNKRLRTSDGTSSPIDSGSCTTEDVQSSAHSRESDTPADSVHLVCSDKLSVLVSQDILSAASPVFDAMLNGGFSEAEHGKVYISDSNSVVIKAFVDYLNGIDLSLTDNSLGHLLALYAVSDKYMVPPLHYDICDELAKWLDMCLSTFTSDEHQQQQLALLLVNSVQFSCAWFAQLCLDKILNYIPNPRSKELVMWKAITMTKSKTSIISGIMFVVNGLFKQ